MKASLLPLLLLPLLSSCFSLDFSLSYLRTLLSDDLSSLNDILNAELVDSLVFLDLPNFALTTADSSSFSISIPGELTFGTDKCVLTWQITVSRHERPPPRYFRYSLYGDSHLHINQCVQADESTQKLERMLSNIVRVMMVRWDVPSWERFSYRGKVAKYVIWLQMIAAGKVEVDNQTLRFQVTPEDLGYKVDQVKDQDNDRDQGSAVALWIDFQVIDQMLKHGTRQVYRLNSPWLAFFPDLEAFLNNTLTLASLSNFLPSLDLSSFPDMTAPVDLYLNPHLPSHSDRLSISQLPNSLTFLEPLDHLQLVSSFAFRLMTPSTSRPQQWSQLASGFTTLQCVVDLTHMQVRGFKMSKLNVRSENPEVSIGGHTMKSGEDVAERVVDLKELADGLQIGRYLGCLGLQVRQVKHQKHGIRVEMEEVAEVEEGQCVGVKGWAEKEVNRAALEVQLQMRYWEEGEKRREKVEEMTRSAQQKQDEL